jgi:hypothetical protein
VCKNINPNNHEIKLSFLKGWEDYSLKVINKRNY